MHVFVGVRMHAYSARAKRPELLYMREVSLWSCGWLLQGYAIVLQCRSWSWSWSWQPTSLVVWCRRVYMYGVGRRGRAEWQSGCVWLSSSAGAWAGCQSTPEATNRPQHFLCDCMHRVPPWADIACHLVRMAFTNACECLWHPLLHVRCQGITGDRHAVCRCCDNVRALLADALCTRQGCPWTCSITCR